MVDGSHRATSIAATRIATTRITTVGVAESLAAIPPGRVVELIGTDLYAFETATDPPPVDAPVAITLVIARATSAAEIVDDVVSALVGAVVDLFPAWLPGGDHLGESEQLDTTAITGLVRRVAAGGGHSVPALAMLARAGLSGRARSHEVPIETLAHECARLLADAYRRDHVCLAVTRTLPDPAGNPEAPTQRSTDGQQALATACEWLAHHASVAVCLIGDPLPDVDRFTPMRWLGTAAPDLIPEEPRVQTGLDVPGSANAAAVVRLPALAGLPHPNSVAEQRLHAHLARQAWATDARWNMTFAPDPLHAPIRVDVAWTAERCVVEIDGDDHRAVAKYAADRRRDNMLQLAGYVVLRFTNDEVLTDISAVATVIENCLHERRALGTSTPSHSTREAHHR